MVNINFGLCRYNLLYWFTECHISTLGRVNGNHFLIFLFLTSTDVTFCYGFWGNSWAANKKNAALLLVSLQIVLSN